MLPAARRPYDSVCPPSRSARSLITGNNVDWSGFDRAAMRWVDPILAPGNSRSKWEEATRQAIKEAAKYELSFVDEV